MSEPTKTIEVTGAIDTRKESLLEFPCDFPIKIMGKAHPEFKDTIFKVVAVHDNEIDVEKIEERGYDVFSGRARTTKAEKLKMAALILAGGR